MQTERRRSPHTNSQRIAHTRKMLDRLAALGVVLAASSVAAASLLI